MGLNWEPCGTYADLKYLVQISNVVNRYNDYTGQDEIWFWYKSIKLRQSNEKDLYHIKKLAFVVSKTFVRYLKKFIISIFMSWKAKTNVFV